MRIETAKRLHDAWSASAEIVELVAGESFASYRTNRVLQLAIERLLAIVGEALGKALQDDRSLRERFPEAALVIGMRHRIVHGYDDVRPDIVWDVTQRHLPALRDRIRSLLDDDVQSPGS